MFSTNYLILFQVLATKKMYQQVTYLLPSVIRLKLCLDQEGDREKIMLLNVRVNMLITISLTLYMNFLLMYLTFVTANDNSLPNVTAEQPSMLQSSLSDGIY